MLLEKVLEFFERYVGTDGHGRQRNGPDFLVPVSEQQVADADYTLEFVALHNDIHVMHSQEFVFRLAVDEAGQHIADGCRHRERGELGHHETAGRVGLVRTESADLVGVFLVQLLENCRGIGPGQFTKHVDTIVTGHFADDRRDIGNRHDLHEVGRIAFGQLFEDVGGALGRDHREQQALLVGAQVKDGRQNLGRRQGIEKALDLSGRSLSPE